MEINLISFLTFVVAMEIFIECIETRCPPRTTGLLQKSAETNEIDFGEIGYPTMLRCCMSGYDVIYWYTENFDDKPTLIDGTFKDDNQTLEIDRVSNNISKILCIAKNFTSNSSIQHEVTLYAYPCVPLEISEATSPLMDTIEITNFPTTVSVNCSVTVGCIGESFESIYWCLPETICSGYCFWNHTTCSKFEQREIKDYVSHSIIKELTIYNITESEVGMSITCAFSGNRVQKNGKIIKNYTVNIKDGRDKKEEKIDQSKKNMTVIIIIALSIVIILLAIALIVKFCLLTSKVKICLRNYLLPGKNSELYELCESDFGVIHTQDDESRIYAQCLVKDLERKNFRVSAFEDICNTTPGQSIEDLAVNCRALLIIPNGMDQIEWEPYICGMKNIQTGINSCKRNVAVIRFNNIGIPTALKIFKVILYIPQNGRKYKRGHFERQLQLLLPVQKHIQRIHLNNRSFDTERSQFLISDIDADN